MPLQNDAIQSQAGLMDRAVSASVRRGVAEALRDARKQALSEDAARQLPAKLANLIDELRQRD